MIISDKDLAEVILDADNEDLGILIDMITDSGKGRMSLTSSVCTQLTNAKSTNIYDEVTRALIAEELSRFGGNSLANFLRGGEGVSYKEIAMDVAKRVKAPFNSQHDCLTIEAAIISKVMEKTLEKMTEEERKEFFSSVGQSYIPGSGPAAMAALLAILSKQGMFQLSSILANATATAFVGRGLFYSSAAVAPAAYTAFIGPIGWAITALWTAYDLSSPAYRVTVPCVIQIAYMRRKKLENPCIKCGTSLPNDAKFCTECGQAQNQHSTLKLTSDS